MTAKAQSLTSNPTPFSISTLLGIAVLLQITWGLVPSASKIVIEDIPVELYVALRWTLSGFIFISYLTLTKSWKRISRTDFFSVSGLGILGYGLASLGTLYGLKIGGVANFALLSALGPVVISTVSILILKEKPNRWFYVALPLCVTGLSLLVLGKYQVSSLQIAGYSALSILIGYTMEAIVFVFSKRFKAKLPIAQYLGIAQCAAAVTFWVLQISYFGQLDRINHLTQRGLLAALFVAVVACVLCYAVLYWLLSYVDGHKLALFDGIHAISASVFGYFLFQEQLTAVMLLGGVLIFCGLLIGTLKK